MPADTDAATPTPTPTFAEIDPDTLPHGADACEAPWWVRVTAVSDGDTVHVEKIDTGTAYVVRLIGVDTPEIAHNSSEVDQCWGPEAAAYTRDALTGAEVWLTFDSGCNDRYERWLAYLHTGVDELGFYNFRLVREGQGLQRTVAPNATFETRFLEAQAQAQAEGKGYWGACVEGS